MPLPFPSTVRFGLGAAALFIVGPLALGAPPASDASASAPPPSGPSSAEAGPTVADALASLPAWKLSDLVVSTLQGHVDDGLRLQAEQQKAIEAIARQTSDQAEATIRALSAARPKWVQEAARSLTDGATGNASANAIRLEAGDVMSIDDLQRKVIESLGASLEGVDLPDRAGEPAAGDDDRDTPPAQRILQALSASQRAALEKALPAAMAKESTGDGRSSSSQASDSASQKASDSASDSSSSSSSSSSSDSSHSSSSQSSSDSAHDSSSSSSSDSSRDSSSGSSRDSSSSSARDGSSGSSRDASSGGRRASNGSRGGDREAGGSRRGGRDARTAPGTPARGAVSADAALRDVLRQIPPERRRQLTGAGR